MTTTTTTTLNECVCMYLPYIYLLRSIFLYKKIAPLPLPTTKKHDDQDDEFDK